MLEVEQYDYDEYIIEYDNESAYMIPSFCYEKTLKFQSPCIYYNYKPVSIHMYFKYRSKLHIVRRMFINYSKKIYKQLSLGSNKLYYIHVCIIYITSN